MFRTSIPSDDIISSYNAVPARRSDVIAQVQHVLSTADPDERVDSAAYLRRTAEAALGLSGKPDTVVTVVYDLGEGILLAAPRMKALGLLAGETLVNAFRHAHPANVAGEVRLSFRRFGNDAALVVEDDGVGLPVGFDPARDGGLGYQIMRDLVGRLKGRMTHQSTPLGLKVEVLFPL